MKPNNYFTTLEKDFWACVRTISDPGREDFFYIRTIQKEDIT